MDSSASMVAVEKATGDCCSFVAVIPELGDLQHSYEVDSEGVLTEIPVDDDIKLPEIKHASDISFISASCEPVNSCKHRACVGVV